MLKFLYLKNWSKLLDHTSDHTNYLEQKRNVLFSQFCIMGIIAAILQGSYDLYEGYPLIMAIDLAIALLLIFGYLLNEHGKHLFSKMLIIITSNFILFSFAAVIPKGVGIYLLFYPLVAFSFIALDFKYRKFSYGLAGLSLMLNGVLVYTTFQPYGSINLQPSDPTFSFALNLLISIAMLSLGIDFLLNITNTAEEKLIENQKHTENLALEINEKNRSLEKTNEELDRFVYSTSHDLRAPLASILGLINLTELEGGSTPEPIKKYIAMMKDRVNNLDDFIKEIIDYSRNTRTEVVLTNVDLQELFDEVILNNRFLKKAETIKFSSEIDINRDLKLDRTRVFRVLNNLVSNAIKYNDLSREQPYVRIKAKFENNSLKIDVTDSGKGIGDEIKANIFDMFYRGTNESEGSGLGLYIASEMMLKMNGTLSFVSSSGKGTTFSVMLPLEDGSST